LRSLEGALRKPLKPRVVRKRFLRGKVFERDAGFCRDCGKFDPKWECDHDVALWRGGADDIDNCVTRCRRCHLKKTVAEAPVRAKTDRLAARAELTKQRREIR
jgi:5-methylcytosine-specific restriction endonuclease McrA